MTASTKTNLTAEEPLYLSSSNIDFSVIVHDEDFDNEDNPYGELRLVIFNNMNGTKLNQVVPLKKEGCKKGFNEENVFSVDKYTHYCPDFSDDHFLKDNYYSKRSSWMRLSINQCNSKKRKCESRDEINKYFRRTILEILMNSVKPVLDDYENFPPTSSAYMDVHYSVRDATDLVYGKEFFIRQSIVEADDTRYGVYDPS